MVRVETSKTVHASQDKIFSLITDFENLPSRFPNRYRSLKVIERSENSVTVEEDVRLREGKYIRLQGIHLSHNASFEVK
jgi:ribosome-associated toxin RatA of RatAB toxin-antitoxin module